MLTREILDELMPDDEPLKAAVDKLTDYSINWENIVGSGLLWIQDFTERQRLGRFDLPRRSATLSSFAYPITAGGLLYKHSGQCMTQLNWRLGETCWFVTVESGYREHITGETPTLALLRAIVVMTVMEKMQQTEIKNADLCEEIRKEM